LDADPKKFGGNINNRYGTEGNKFLDIIVLVFSSKTPVSFLYGLIREIFIYDNCCSSTYLLSNLIAGFLENLLVVHGTVVYSEFGTHILFYQTGRTGSEFGLSLFLILSGSDQIRNQNNVYTASDI
jgi:hypothetical protein